MNGTLPARDRGYRGGDPRGNPDLAGLCLALSDWHAELRILQDEVQQHEDSHPN